MFLVVLRVYCLSKTGIDKPRFCLQNLCKLRLDLAWEIVDIGHHSLSKDGTNAMFAFTKLSNGLSYSLQMGEMTPWFPHEKNVTKSCIWYQIITPELAMPLKNDGSKYCWTKSQSTSLCDDIVSPPPSILHNNVHTRIRSLKLLHTPYNLCSIDISTVLNNPLLYCSLCKWRNPQRIKRRSTLLIHFFEGWQLSYDTKKHFFKGPLFAKVMEFFFCCCSLTLNSP